MSRNGGARYYTRTSCARSELQLRSTCVLQASDGCLNESLTLYGAVNHCIFAATRKTSLGDYPRAEGVCGIAFSGPSRGRAAARILPAVSSLRRLEPLWAPSWIDRNDCPNKDLKR